MDWHLDKVMLFACGLLVIVALIALPVAGSMLIWQWRQQGKGATHLEAKQLHFAAVTLTGLGLLFTLAMAMYFWGEGDANAKGGSAPKEIFDACKTIIPPIVTLILGYYFGSKGSERSSSPPLEPIANSSPE